MLTYETARGLVCVAVMLLGYSTLAVPETALAQTQELFIVPKMNGASAPAFRRDQCFYFDDDWNGSLDRIHCDYALTDQYLWGVWTNDGKVGLARRLGNCITFPSGLRSCYPIERVGYEVLVGDWNGDRRDDVVFRFDGVLAFDTNLDGNFDGTVSYGYGDAEEGYLLGNFDGIGGADLAVIRGDCALIDLDRNGLHDRQICVGGPRGRVLVGHSRSTTFRDSVYIHRDGCVAELGQSVRPVICYDREVCGNIFDDDGNGQVNENCVEICGNDIDEDRDGLSDGVDPDCKVLLRFSNVDDTARAWLGNDVICDFDSGAYPRAGTCDLTAVMTARNMMYENTVQIRLGNGGGGVCSGDVALLIGGKTIWSRSEPAHWNVSFGWFFERKVRIDFAKSRLVWAELDPAYGGF